ncbi:MerR family transcriptional regulator [Streptomyces sp. Amel2xC10]|uniref:MerR family transcriptional regulator n=1 Tax=Streptomyces sp. Amel2xC10 TaxID=1305826 RepID=UPI000A087D6D|nr:MerR family transcriptional regulator [Streptomyces sp. Amel2xC10]SME87812.1 transcriptional regulator, MerR family [Streptomyces sp. Amel2xC10]
MRIGELARRTGVSRRSLRYYEEQNLLTPTRLPNGYRDYDERTVTTVRRIQILLSAGLGTSTVAEILPGAVDDTVVLAGKCPELIDGLAKEHHRIDTAIEALVAARDILDSLVGRPLDPRTPVPLR